MSFLNLSDYRGLYIGRCIVRLLVADCSGDAPYSISILSRCAVYIHRRLQSPRESLVKRRSRNTHSALARAGALHVIVHSHIRLSAAPEDGSQFCKNCSAQARLFASNNTFIFLHMVCIWHVLVGCQQQQSQW